jgi:type IV secretory pathway VirJ component
MLSGLVRSRLESVVPGSNRDLPGSLVEMRATGANDVLVILLSGDGGWRDLDRTIATYMQSHGTSVVGWDSLRYFWHAKTPERVGSDLGEVIRRYTKEWGARDVVLVGFSFGADVLPFAYNRLGDEERGKVKQMSLLALSKQADFEIRVTGWLGAKSAAGAPPVGPELDRVPAGILQCFYGEEDDDSNCPDIASRGVEEVRTTGDHHFDGDYEALARRILDGAARRRAAPAR